MADILRDLMRKRRVEVKDLMQSSYVYFCTEPVGKHFDPDFQPELTPKQMLELGVFGGKYMTDCVDEFPAAWFQRAKLCSEHHDSKLTPVESQDRNACRPALCRNRHSSTASDP